MAPIFLPNITVVKFSDDAGILINKTVLPTYTSGPYTPEHLPEHLKIPDELRYVPPLQYFCIKPLVQNVDAIDLGDCLRISYEPKSHNAVLKGFINFFSPELVEHDMVYVDPRIWGVLIQIYSSLPDCFLTYTLPLSDTHLTLLQGIKSTSDFTLITVLDLASRSQLDDETIGALKPLSHLCVLDISGTRVGSWGVRKLSMCLVGSGAQRSGPWRLRVLSMRGCQKVDDSIKDSLSKFPLLSVVDLRETSVKASVDLTGFSADPPPSHDSLYFPTPPLEWVPALSKIFPQSHLFEADPQKSPPHVLHINKLHHTIPIRGYGLFASSHRQQVGDQDSVVALLPNGRQAVHTAHGLAREAEEAAGEQRREKGLRRWQKQQAERWREEMHQENSWDGDGERRHSGSDEHDYYNDSDEPAYYNDSDGPYYSVFGGYESEDFGEFEDAATILQSKAQDAQNEVAALVNAREAAERAAYTFYAKSKMEKVESTLRLRGGALPGDLRLMVTNDGHQASGSLGQRNSDEDSATRRREGSSSPDIILPPLKRHRPLVVRKRVCRLDPIRSSSTTPDPPQRNLMFFRIPPSFNSIPDKEIVGSFKRKNTDKELISVKRRKGSTVISDSCSILLDRRRKTPLGSQLDPRPTVEEKFRGRTRPSTTSFPVGTETKEKSLEPPSQSKNPFLAKKKVAQQRRKHIAAPEVGVSSVSHSKKFGSTPLPAKFSSEKENPRSTRRQKGVQESVQSHADIETKKGLARCFDMKAWARKAK